VAPNDLPDWTSVFARPQTQLGGSPWSAPAGTNTQTFTLAADTSIICVLIPNFFNITSLQVHGVTSGFTYVKAEPLKTSYHPYYVAAINSAVDSAITVTVTTGVTTTVYVSSIPDPIAAITLPNQPAPWEAPNQPGIAISFANPGQNNTAQIVPAPVNAQSIYLHTMAWVWTAAAATANGRFIDGGGTAVGKDAPITAGVRAFMDFKGAKLAGGDDFHFVQDGAAAAGTTNCYGFLTYAIY
jgi:hypothetical protein